MGTELTNVMQEAQTPVETPAVEIGAPGATALPAPKGYGKWAVRIDYDPEKRAGARPEDFQTPADEYVKRFYARTKIQPVDADGKEAGAPVIPEFMGVLQEPVFEAKRGDVHGRFIRWKPRKLNSLTEAVAWTKDDGGAKKKRLIEQFGIGFLGDLTTDDVTLPGGLSPTRLIDQEFVPLMAGPFFKQLYLYDYLLMHARAFQLKNHNALAAGAVKILTRFVVGRGVTSIVKHQKANAVWQEFWERNKMRDKIRLMAEDLTWQGELMLRYYEPKRGYTTLRLLDASTCWEVVTDPEDVEEVYYYHFQWPTPYQIWVSGNIPVSKYIVQQIPPTNIQHLKINCSAQERRGRSDFLPAMAWLKRFDDFYNGQTVKSLLEANLVWVITVKGDQADVDAFLSNPALTELPPPGGVWIQNEAVKLEPQSAAMTANRGSQGVGQQLASVVATSLNLPNEYFNIEAGAGGARATALVRTDPAVKAIEDRQQRMKETVEEIYDRVMTNALIAGRIPKEAAREDPEITTHGGDGDDDDEAPDPSTLPKERVQSRLVKLR